MRAFTLLLLLCVISCETYAQPKIFWASDPVRPNETVLVSGHGFGDSPRVEFVRLSNGAIGSPPGALDWPRKSREIKPIQADDKGVKFVVPPNVELGTYAVRVIGRNGASERIRLNCPVPYWAQGDIGVNASPGGWVRIFGRCLAAEGKQAKVVLTPVRSAHANASQGDHSPTTDITAEPATEWSLTTKLPQDIPLGRYRIFVHNGLGGRSGWSEAGRITVAKREQWPQKVLNVKDFGASGKGGPADDASVRMALKKAEENGGGVVYFPRGRYQITHTLEVPRYTVLSGEGADLACIFWPDAQEPYTLIQGADHFGLEDLTIYASNYTHCIAASLGKPDSGNTFLRRIRVRADIYRGHLKPQDVDRRFRRALRLSSGGGDTVRFGGENVEITDCDLYGSGRSLYLRRVRGARITGNTFYNGRWGWYDIDGCDGVILEGNRFIGADLMSTGGGISCFTGGYSQNIYYAHNKLQKAHGWDREAMTTDAGYGAYFGAAAEIGPDKLVLAKDANWKMKKDWRGAGVFILGGKGMGQYRRIASYEGRTVTLDRPWTVMPDKQSVITITMLHRNYLFIGNEFEDVGIALQYYGTSIDCVAFGNKCTRGGGFYNSGRWYRHFQPSWFCQFIENEILEGNCYRFGPNNSTNAGDSFLGTFGLQAHGGKSPLALASIHRRNHLHNNALIRIIGVNEEYPGVRDVVVEHNLIENTDTGIYVDSGCVGVLLRENRFKNVDRKTLNEREIKKELQAKRAALLDQRDPVAHYSFDEPIDSTLRDDSGHNFWARATGDIAFERGVKGKAPRFDGSRYFVVDDEQMLQFPRITVSAWILPDLVKGRWGVVAKRSRGAVAPYVIAVREGGITFEATDRKGEWSYNMTSRSVLKPRVWSHITAVCEEGVGVKVYCNGELVGEKKVNEQLVDTTDVLTIGYEDWGGIPAKAGQSGNFHGLIDEVKIWSRLLSADEIRAEYESLSQQAESETKRIADELAAEAARAQKYATSIAAAGGVNWKLVKFDDFNRDAIGADWKTLRGRWFIKEGRVCCSETSFLAYVKKVRSPVRIEFDARSANPGDLTAFWGTRQEAYKGGYFIGFASNGNTANKILRLNEQVISNDAPLASPNKWHHIIGQVFDGKVQLIVDGKLALEYQDATPVSKADTAGMIAWSEGEFDNVRIYTGQ